MFRGISHKEILTYFLDLETASQLIRLDFFFCFLLRDFDTYFPDLQHLFVSNFAFTHKARAFREIFVLGV